MIEEAGRYGEIFALAIAAMGAGIIGYSIICKRSIFVMAAGAVLAAAALVAPMLLRGQPINVMVVQASETGIKILRSDGFYSGNYLAKNGQTIAIDRKRSWGPTATFLINDSDRLVTLASHHYSSFRFAGGRSDLLSYLLPQEYRAFPRRISYTGDAVTGPPITIKSIGTSDAIIFLGYSRQPYEPKQHGDETLLEAKIAVPQIMERVSFKQEK